MKVPNSNESSCDGGKTGGPRSRAISPILPLVIGHVAEPLCSGEVFLGAYLVGENLAVEGLGVDTEDGGRFSPMAPDLLQDVDNVFSFQ